MIYFNYKHCMWWCLLFAKPINTRTNFEHVICLQYLEKKKKAWFSVFIWIRMYSLTCQRVVWRYDSNGDEVVSVKRREKTISWLLGWLLTSFPMFPFLWERLSSPSSWWNVSTKLTNGGKRTCPEHKLHHKQLSGQEDTDFKRYPKKWGKPELQKRKFI